MGVYLRVAGGGRALVVGAKKGTGARGHWEGFAQGGPRRFWDVVVPREALVAIEWALHERGLLQPRSAQAAWTVTSSHRTDRGRRKADGRSERQRAPYRLK